MSPFFANKRYYPDLQVQTIRELLSQTAKTFIANLEEIHRELKRAIAEVQKHYQGPADTHRSTAPTFKIRDPVYVLAKFIQTT